MKRFFTFLAVLALTLSGTSCSGVLAYMASPAGQLTTAAAKTLAVNLAKQGEASILRQSIDTLGTQITSYEATPVPASIPQQFLLAAKIDGLKAARIAAQQQYQGLTGKDYPLAPSTSGK